MVSSISAGIISNASSPSDGDPMKVQRSRASLLQCLLAKLHALKLTTDKAGLLAITSPSQPVAPRPSWLFLQPNNSHPPHSPIGAGYRRFPEAPSDTNIMAIQCCLFSNKACCRPSRMIRCLERRHLHNLKL